jgi:HEAT repeat protein
MNNEQLKLTRLSNKSKFPQSPLPSPHSPVPSPHSPVPSPHSLLPIFFTLCSLLFASAFVFAQSEEETRLNTLKYGTETEIAALIQALKTEGVDYLDSEIVKLVENTRNNKILGGAFTFFAEREKTGLEARAVRAIEEREDEENETVLSAIDYLGKIKAVSAAPVFRGLLESGEKRFLNAAFRSLGQVSGNDADGVAEYLIDYYENRDIGDDNQRDIITAIGAAGSAKAIPFLAGIAGDNNARPTLRMTALDSIAKIGDPAGLDAVLACVSARDPNIRSTAVAALGPFSGKAVDDAILDSFRDSFYKTRIAAAQASRQRKFAAAVPYLKFRAENDDVPQVKEEAISALGAIAGSEAIKTLEELFTAQKNSDRVRIAAGEALMQNEPNRFLDAFIKEMDGAKQKNQTALYNGFLKIIGGTKCSGLEAITLRLMQDKGIIEKSIALDMAANNSLTALADEIKTIAGDKNESLARKARRTMEKLGISN